MAPPGSLIGTITAKDLDSGRFGTNGIRYSLSGTGSELFNVNERTGAITIAECPREQNRQRRQIDDEMYTTSSSSLSSSAQRVNLTITGETGVIDVDDNVDATTEVHFPFGAYVGDELAYRPFYTDDYMVLSDSAEESAATSSYEHEYDHVHSEPNENALKDTTFERSRNEWNVPTTSGPGHSPCLDYEAQSVYFLSFKVSCSAFRDMH